MEPIPLPVLLLIIFGVVTFVGGTYFSLREYVFPTINAFWLILLTVLVDGLGLWTVLLVCKVLVYGLGKLLCGFMGGGGDAVCRNVRFHPFTLDL